MTDKSEADGVREDSPPDDTLAKFLVESGLSKQELEMLIKGRNVQQSTDSTQSESTANSSFTQTTPQDSPSPSTNTNNAQCHSADSTQNLVMGNVPRLPRLGLFSGKEPVKQGEVDWGTFRDVAMEIASMTGIDERSKRREIITRLVAPAKDFAKLVVPNSSAIELVSYLDGIYGAVENKNLLLQEFMGMIQEKNERPSDFLKRLQLKVSRLVEVAEFSPGAAAQKLFDRFMMGCHDEYILTVTNLHNQIIAPPFSRLISIIREAEATRDAKLAQYKSTPKQPARSFSQQLDALSLYGQSSNQFSPPGPPSTPQSGNAPNPPKNKPKGGSPKATPSPQPPTPTRGHGGRPFKLVVCYNCGELNHVDRVCNNPPNEEKKKVNLAHRQRMIEAWEAMNNATTNQPSPNDH